MRLAGIAGFTLVAALALAAACGGGGDGAIAEGKGPLALYLERTGDAYRLRWEDQDGESKYRISGTAVYWSACVTDKPDWTDKTTFSNTLAADSTEYDVPEAGGGSDFFLKEFETEIVAVGSDDSEIVQDGITFTAEPPACD